MFCALKGATCRPSCTNIRQRAAARTDLPTWDIVPCTMMTLPVRSPATGFLQVSCVVPQVQGRPFGIETDHRQARQRNLELPEGGPREVQEEHDKGADGAGMPHDQDVRRLRAA